MLGYDYDSQTEWWMGWIQSENHHELSLLELGSNESKQPRLKLNQTWYGHDHWGSVSSLRVGIGAQASVVRFLSSFRNFLENIYSEPRIKQKIRYLS